MRSLLRAVTSSMGLPPRQVDVKVKDGLSAALAGVERQAVTFFRDAHFFGHHLWRSTAGGRPVLHPRRSCRSMNAMCLRGKNEQMQRREGVDGCDHHALVILEEDLRGGGLGDNVAENAICHKRFWLQVPCL